MAIETTAETSLLKKFNPGNLPPAGSEWCGKYFNKLWEDARKEKIGRLLMHQRFIELHAAYRGKKQRKKYPRVGANFLFKMIESYSATLTEKVPISDISADDADDPRIVKAMAHECEEWWKASNSVNFKDNKQTLLHASVQNMGIYGTTIEKGFWDIKKDDVGVDLKDAFNIFPAPGYVMCDTDLPYMCDVDFLEEWEIRNKFGVPDEIEIPSDASEQLAGTIRETTRGGRDQMVHTRNYPSNYADTTQSPVAESLQDKTLVVEIWVRDNSVTEEPIIENVPILDDLGRDTGYTEDFDTGEVRTIPNYIDGIRKVTICPALLNNPKVRGMLDDIPNPNINWELLEVRANMLTARGIPQPAVDQAGNPVVGPDGTPQMQFIQIPEEQAREMIYERARICYPLWGQFPYTVTPSRVDSSQWWGFSIIEQLEEQQGKAEQMLTKYFTALERAMFPIFINPQGSGVEDSEITNDPGLVLRPIASMANSLGYVEAPQPPREYLDAIEFLMRLMDIIGMHPDVSEGRRPTGISAAAAIIALQDKASTLFAPQVRQIDHIVNNRGRFYLHFKMNFDTTPRQVKIDDEFIPFRGVDVFSNFKYNVESGSSAPITKAGRRQQFVELFKLNAMDVQSLLENLEIPNVSLIMERLAEQNSVMGALKVLVQAGLPQEVIPQIMMLIQGDQNKPNPQGGTTMPTAEDKAAPAGGYSEGINAAKQGMAELREG